MAPYISNTNDICYYDNYDISTYLCEGKNVIGIILGNGFRNPFGGFVWDFDKSESCGPVITAFCLEAKDDNNSLILEADETVKTHPSPILMDDLRMGYRYDARLEIPDWNMPGYDASHWQNAKRSTIPAGEKKLCTAEPIKVSKILSPVSVKHYDELAFAYDGSGKDAKPLPETVRKNVYVYDFGINTAGVAVLKINGTPGQKITIRHAEHLVNGNFAENSIVFMWKNDVQDKYLEFSQVNEFICKGGYEVFVPQFKFDGFRYIFVEGLREDQATADAFSYHVMHSDLFERADFKCSNETLNKLQACARNSDLSNFFYYPTDCPHREKNGWTGDASVSAEHMLLTLKATKSFKEWMCNIRKAQKEDGQLPGIVPTGGWGYEWGNGPAWDAVIVNLPYFCYRFDGDKDIILDNAATIIRYFYYINRRRNDKGLIEIGLGDWQDPYQNVNGHISAPLEVTDTLEIIDITKKAAHLFNEVGLVYEKELSLKLAEDLTASFRKHLIDFSDMTVKGNCQTSQAMAICIGVFNDDELALAQQKLVEIVHRDEDENHCGMLGLRYIYHALFDMNEHDLAFKMMLSENRTGYGYVIKQGHTSLLESMIDEDIAYDSRNHHFFGDFSSVTIQEIAGLKPNPHCNDLSYFEISPRFIKALDYAEAYYHTDYGIISIKWQREADVILLTTDVPRGIKGNICLPLGYEAENFKNTTALCTGKNIYEIRCAEC